MNNLTTKQNDLIDFLLINNNKATAGITGLGLGWSSHSVSSVAASINNKHPGLVVVSEHQVYGVDVDLYLDLTISDECASDESVLDLDLDHGFIIRDASYDLNHDFITTGIAYGNYVTEEVAKSIQWVINNHFAGEYAEYDVLRLAQCTNSVYDNEYKLGEINNGGEWLFGGQDFYVLSFADSDVVLLLTKE